ncbi:MAG: Mobile element protein [Nocardia sp.]|uniref:helix-turn-helix domain-containing protein n=1 Tax=Nocardia sp. TaxID=1821 RepID=UPI0026253586|nr:helix-turn-helix domain-containing protein [Nocardia sp.]MCU1648175.1 Mobile element protein [Nocardia sp.]
MMKLTGQQLSELHDLVECPDVPTVVGKRAQMMLWYDQNRSKAEIATLAGVSWMTVDRWLSRYLTEGIAGLLDHRQSPAHKPVPAGIRSKILVATHSAPPNGLPRWSSREMAKFIARTEGVAVSHNYVAALWRKCGLKPLPHGTLEPTMRTADIVGIYLAPPGGAVVLCSDEVRHTEAVDEVVPLIPIHVAPLHGIVGRGRPGRASSGFLSFLCNAAKPHAGKDIQVVVDNLSTRTTPDARIWLAANPQIRVRFALAGSTRLTEIEEWVSIAAEQSIQRGNADSVRSVTDRLRNYIKHPGANSSPFIWAANPNEILASATLIQTNVRRVIRRRATTAPPDPQGGTTVRNVNSSHQRRLRSV